MSLRILGRGLLVLLLDALALLLLSEVLSGFVLDGARAALGAAAAIGLLNALIWPVLARFALPLTVLTLGARGAAPQRRSSSPSRSTSCPGPQLDGVLEGIVVTIAMSGAHRGLLLAAGDRRGRLLVPQRRRAGRRGGAGSIGRERGARASSSSRSTASPTTSCTGRWPTADAPNLAAWLRGGSHRLEQLGDRLVLADRRLPGRASCTAPTTTCRPSAGGRRTATRRSSPTTRATPKSSSAATPTGAGCCTPTAPAAPTSSPATRRTRC